MVVVINLLATTCEKICMKKMFVNANRVKNYNLFWGQLIIHFGVNNNNKFRIVNFIADKMQMSFRFNLFL